MIKTLLLSLSLLLPLRLAVAEDAAPVSPTAETGQQDDDVYYAPDVAEDGATGATPSAAVAQVQGAYVSRAQLHVIDFTSGHEVNGAELFLGPDYLGRSPLTLKGLVVSPGTELGARLDGYEEALRPGLHLPADGEVRVALLRENAASWYTTPAWVLGLGLLAASVAVYRSDNTGPGLALVGGGVGVIALSQLTARFMHLPALRRQVQDYNASPQAVPAP